MGLALWTTNKKALGGRRMKLRFMLFALFFTVAGVLAACSDDQKPSDDAGGSDNDGEEQFVLRFAHIVEEDNPAHEAAILFKEEVEKESDGRITVNLFPNGSLYGSDREIIEALQLGNIELSTVGTPSLGNFDENFYVLDLPYVFKDKEVARTALAEELGDKLAESLKQKSNLVTLGYGYDGFRHVLNNKHAVEEPADMKGLKFRVQESELQQDIFSNLGTNPSPLAFGELYTSLQQNTFDGMDNTISLINSGKFYEVQEYLSLTSHSYSATITMIGGKVFDKLPEDLQEIVLTAGQNMETEYYKFVDDYEADSLANFEENALIEINDISSENREKFIEAIQPVNEKYTKKLDDGLFELAKTYND